MKLAGRWILVVVVAFAAVPGTAAATHAPDSSSAMTEVFTSPNQATNSDLAFWGDHAFVGYSTGDTGFPAGSASRGGVRIFDVSDPAAPKLVRDFACDGGENDPVVWDRNGNGVADLLLLAVDRTMANPNCGAPRSAHGDRNGWEGVRIFEMSDNPASPFQTITPLKMQYTDCGAHAITAWPGLAEDGANPRLVVYVASYPLRSGPTCGQANFNNVTNPYDPDKVVNDPLHRQIQVLSVPLGNPAATSEVAAPRIVYPGDPDGRIDWCERGRCSTPQVPLEPAAVACHDVFVHVALAVAAAGCGEQAQLWTIDANGIPDTANPVLVLDDQVSSGGRGSIPGAADFFSSARLSDDGTVVNAVDESFGAGCPAMTTWQSRPWNPAGGTHETGRMAFAERDGDFLSEFSAGDLRPDPAAGEYCSAGAGAILPATGRDLLVNAWHTGGVNVIDFTAPASPMEVAFFDPQQQSGTSAAYPYVGPRFSSGAGIPVYASDGVTGNALADGLAVYRTNVGGAVRPILDHLNPQTLEPPAAACDPSPEPAGCWHFDEDGGATALDSSSNANNGTYVNGPLLRVAGVLATAVSMDGANDHVRVPDSASLDTGDSFSLVGWIKRDEDGRTHQLFNKGGRSYQLTVMSRFEGNQVWLRKAGSATIVRSNGGVPADGAFHQVVATKNGPNSAQLYIDGVPQTEQVVSGVQVIENTTFPLYFSSTPSGNVVAGDLDEFAVYDVALTPGEVAADYAAAAPATAALMATRTAAKPSASGCGKSGSATSGIARLHVTGVPCKVATKAAFAGLKAVEALGFTCVVTDEDFKRAVTRITHSCAGPLGRSLRYTSVS